MTKLNKKLYSRLDTTLTLETEEVILAKRISLKTSANPCYLKQKGIPQTPILRAIYV